LGDFFRAKISPKSLGYFFQKKFAQCHNKSPKWRIFAQSGHPVWDQNRISQIQNLRAEIHKSSYDIITIIILAAKVNRTFNTSFM
jgi:hypothetical protein